MRAPMQAVQCFAAIVLICLSSGLSAAPVSSPSAATSFPIGSGQSICNAQDNLLSTARANVFDRSWTIVCRDATRPVGQVYALRGTGIPAARIEKARLETLDCTPAQSETVSDLGAVQARVCRSEASQAGWKSYWVERGGRTYVAEGATAYDQALKVALRSAALDRVLKDQISIPVLDPGAAGAYYRLQASQSDPAARLEQGYRSNNAGSYAEAVEYFDFSGAVQSTGASDGRNLQHEMEINRALQLSNLGKFAEADAAYASARAMQVTDPVQARLARNLEAMNEINQRVLDFAQGILDQPMPTAPAIAGASGNATAITDRIGMPMGSRGGATSGVISLATALSPAERSALLDAQAAQLSGTVQRLLGRNDLALARFDQALAGASGVRNGRVTAAYRLRAQILTEKALLLETTGDLGQAEALLRNVRALITNEYPDSQATQAATAGLAAFLARHDRKDEALGLYRDLAVQLIDSRSQLVGLTNRISPYFDLLAERIPSDPALVPDLWAMSQTIGRPGAAGTLEQLSRSMASGDNQGAALYRQSIGLKRDIERSNIQIAQLVSAQGAGEGDKSLEIGQLRDRVAELSAQQVGTLGQLAAYPQFRAIETGALSQQDMLALLKPGEAYMKVAAIGDSLYAVYLSAGRQTGWKLAITGPQLTEKVNKLRDSISLTVNGVQSTYPFDVDTARALYLDLFAPVDGDLKSVRHLIFEPDGALLKLPVNLLIASQAGVDAYHARTKAANADDYDFRGIDWLGRTHAISTALSPTSFRDLRRLPASTAQRAYLGLGHNAPVTASALPASVMKLRGATDADGTNCNWPLDAWNNPIADKELQAAAAVYGRSESDLLTGAGFTDTAILGRQDLSQFKVIHFATHGLVDAPRRSCPARPALLTSFGTQNSDGLLEFREIFDLHLDADLVVLSACDTAAAASEATTREAGIESGGGTSLDGLVRAFIGAGSRTVVASHWPAPDDFDATYRLMTGFLGAPKGTSVGDALRGAEVALMDDQATSHPFYWSASPSSATARSRCPSGNKGAGKGAMASLPATVRRTWRNIREAGPRRLAVTLSSLLLAVLIARFGWSIPIIGEAELALYDSPRAGSGEAERAGRAYLARGLYG